MTCRAWGSVCAVSVSAMVECGEYCPEESGGVQAYCDDLLGCFRSNGIVMMPLGQTKVECYDSGREGARE